MITDKSEIERVVSLIKKEIENSELAKKIVELDSKLVELRKSVESIVIELTYIKDELKELRGDKKKILELKREDSITKFQRERLPEKQVEKVTLRTVERAEEQKNELDDKDLIICD